MFTDNEQCSKAKYEGIRRRNVGESKRSMYETFECETFDFQYSFPSLFEVNKFRHF